MRATNTVCVIGPSLTAEAKATVFWLRDQLVWRLLLNCAVRVYDIVVVCCLFLYWLFESAGSRFLRPRRLDCLKALWMSGQLLEANFNFDFF